MKAQNGNINSSGTTGTTQTATFYSIPDCDVSMCSVIIPKPTCSQQVVDQKKPAMAEYDAIMAYVVKQHPRALTVEERLDILYLHAYYRKQGVQAVAQLIASAIGRSVEVVRQVWTQYTSTERVVAAPSPGNRTNHRTRVPDTKLVLEQVQEFLRDK